MSMNATFVQVDEAEIARFRADPSLVEMLFQDGPLMPPVFTALAKPENGGGRTSSRHHS